ncbi:hypothetical protein AAVH_36181, partial [Aphelenchoides avenae]
SVRTMPRRAPKKNRSAVLKKRLMEMDSEQPPKDDDKKVQLTDLPIPSTVEPVRDLGL